MYTRRQTTRMRLSKYAAYNTYHHCEQCHQYMGFNPTYQVKVSIYYSADQKLRQTQPKQFCVHSLYFWLRSCMYFKNR